MPRGGKPKRYPDEMVEQVRSLYDKGATQYEIADVLGVSQKVIWRLMMRHEIKARPAVKRAGYFTRERCVHWKGDEASYTALHHRMTARRGQPKKCERCGTDDEGKSYDWANLTGRYADPDDYQRMCRSCHRQYDRARQGGDV